MTSVPFTSSDNDNALRNSSYYNAVAPIYPFKSTDIIQPNRPIFSNRNNPVF